MHATPGRDFHQKSRRKFEKVVEDFFKLSEAIQNENIRNAHINLVNRRSLERNLSKNHQTFRALPPPSQNVRVKEYSHVWLYMAMFF